MSIKTIKNFIFSLLMISSLSFFLGELRAMEAAAEDLAKVGERAGGDILEEVKPPEPEDPGAGGQEEKQEEQEQEQEGQQELNNQNFDDAAGTGDLGDANPESGLPGGGKVSEVPGGGAPKEAGVPKETAADAAKSDAKAADQQPKKEAEQKTQEQARQQSDKYQDVNDAIENKVNLERKMENAKAEKSAADKNLKEAKTKKENLEKQFKGKPNDKVVEKRLNDAKQEFRDATKRASKAKVDVEETDLQLQKSQKGLNEMKSGEFGGEDMQIVRDKAQNELKGASRELKDLKNIKEKMNPEGRLEEKYGTKDAQDFENNLREKQKATGKPSESEIKKKVDEFKSDETSFKQDGEHAKTELKEKYGDDFEKKFEDDLKTKEEKAQDLKAKIDEIDSQLSVLHSTKRWFKKAFGSTKALLRKLEWIVEQFMVGIAFMLPGDVVQTIQAEKALEALYKTIAGQQTFGGIKMVIVPGLVAEKDPSSGLFIYVDTDGSDISGSYLRNQNRRFFASVNAYGEIGKDYVGNGVTQMVELVTGYQFDAAGNPVDPTQLTLPLVSSLVQNASKSTIAKFIDGQYETVAGHKVAMKAGDLFGDSVGSSFYQKYSVAPHGNSTFKALITKDKNDDFYPLFHPTLAAYIQGIQLPNFGTGQGIRVAGVTGIDRVANLLQSYDAYFGVDAKYADKGIQILTELSKNNGQSDLLNTAFTGKMPGLSPATCMLADGVYVYETTDTPMAQFLASVLPPVLARYAKDYVVATDLTGALIPIQIPQVVSNDPTPSGAVVQLVENPNIAAITSLVSGITLNPGLGFSPAVADDGSIDYTIANNMMDQGGASTVASSYRSYPELLLQIKAMREIATQLIVQGPFNLGKYQAHLVTGLAGMWETDDQAAKDAADAKINSLGNTAQGIQAAASTDMSMSDKRKALDIDKGGGIFIYEVKNALLDTDGNLTVSDYVIPVTPNSATNNYLIVPLGMHAASKSGLVSSAQVSTSVTALVSLITGKMFTPTYDLLPNAYTTNIVRKGATAADSFTCTADSTAFYCINGQPVYKNGRNVPLNKAFMESSLNPLNAGLSPKSALYIPTAPQPPFSLYFTNFVYDYCNSLVSNNPSNFIAISKVTDTTTLPTQLMNVLPATFKNTLLDAHKDWMAGFIGHNPAELVAQEGPLNIPGTFWELTCPYVDALKSGYYIYSILTPQGTLNGLWVAATFTGVSGLFDTTAMPATLSYTPTTSEPFASVGRYFHIPPVNVNDVDSVPIVKQVQRVTKASFSRIGQSYYRNNGANALLNIVTGEVLLIGTVPNSTTNKKDTVIMPLVNNGGLAIMLDPAGIVDSFMKPVSGSTKTSDIYNRIIALQAGSTHYWYGPYHFGINPLLLSRDQVNSGNYIYQAFKGTMQSPQIYDYFITKEPNPADPKHALYGNPLNQNTALMVSLVTGLEYSRADLGGTYTSTTNSSGDPQQLKTIFNNIEAKIVSQSGVEIDDALLTNIHTLQNDYIATLTDESPLSKQGTNPSLVQAILAEINSSGFSIPDFTQFKAVPDSLLLTDGTNFYLPDNLTSVNKTLAKVAGTQQIDTKDNPKGFYAFNIQTTAAKGKINPVGVYFEWSTTISTPGYQALNILTGKSAYDCAAAYGITLQEDGTQTRSLPLERKALIMSPADKNLAGGKNGSVMQLIKTPKSYVSTGSGTSYYLYENTLTESVSSTNTDGQSSNSVATVSSPSDILLQVNNPNFEPYYISLLSGFEYTIDGQPRAVVPQRAYKVSDTNKTQPFIMWQEDTQKFIIPITIGQAVFFEEYRTADFGTSYTYTPDGTTIYIYTHQLLDQKSGVAGQKVYKYQITYPVPTRATYTKVAEWPTKAPSADETATYTAAQLGAKNMTDALASALAAGEKPMTTSYTVERIINDIDLGIYQTMTVISDDLNGFWKVSTADGKTVNFQKVSQDTPSNALFSTQVYGYISSRAAGSTDVPVAEFIPSNSKYFVVLTNNSSSSPTINFIYNKRYYALTKNKTYAPVGSSDGATYNFEILNSPLLLAQNTQMNQLSTDLAYAVVKADSIKNDPKEYIYQPVYKEDPLDRLQGFYDQLKCIPLTSSEGVTGLVYYVDTKALTPITTAQVHADDNQSFSAYQAALTAQLDAYYDGLIMKANNDFAMATCKLQVTYNNNKATWNNTVTKGAQRDGSHPLPTASETTLMKKLCAEQDALFLGSQRYKESIAKEKQKTLDAINANLSSLAQLLPGAGTGSSVTPRLFYSQANQYVLYKISADDSALDCYTPDLIGGYIVLFTSTNSSGFILDANGAPTGSIADQADMATLRTQCAGLVVETWNPLKLIIPLKKIQNSAPVTPFTCSESATFDCAVLRK